MTEVFKKLTDYQHARARVEVYLGGREPTTQVLPIMDGTGVKLAQQTWVPSIFTGTREIIDNALDELVSHGHGDEIHVSYDEQTRIIEVLDNGRGLPLDEKPELGKGPAASILLGEAKAGRNFGERGDVAGANGMGASIVNFCAEWFELTVWRDGQELNQRWEEGTYRKEDIHKTSGPKLTKCGKTKHGTRIRYKVSDKVWPHYELPVEFLESRLWEIALATPTIKVHWNGKRLEINKRSKDPIGDYLKADAFEVNTERVKGKFYVTDGIADEEFVYGTVNNIPVFQGGRHLDEFRNAFYAAIIARIDPMVKKELGITRVKDAVVTRADVSGGLFIYSAIRMTDPRFGNQAKTILDTDIRADVRTCVDDKSIASFVRSRKDWFDKVVERCRNRTQEKEKKKLDKDQKKITKTRVASLIDASGRDRTKCVLYIAEGESAISGMTAVRDATIHGGIGLRGKIMNVNGVKPSKVLESKALVDIMGSLGIKIGERTNRLHMRYGKVYICTDEDEDGKNITALIVNFLHTYWPELFDPKNPFVYRFCTPLIILVKGKERKYIYADQYDAFEPSEYKGWQIIRAKGLARLTNDDWKHSVRKPKVIPLVGDELLPEVLDLVFNKTRADDRKVWLQDD